MSAVSASIHGGLVDPLETSPVAWRRAVRNPSLMIGASIVTIVVLAALISLVWTPYGPLAVNPNHVLASPSARHLLGTDEYGRLGAAGRRSQRALPLARRHGRPRARCMSP